MAAVTICSDSGAQNNKVSVSIVSPSIYHEVMGLDAMISVFWMLSFKPNFSLSSFTFIKRIFSSSLSAIRVVSSVYLRLFVLILKYDQWVIFDVTTAIVLGCHDPYSYEMLNLIKKYVCSDWSTNQPFPLFLSWSLFPALIPWDTTTLKSGQLITLQGPLSVQVKGNISCVSQ